MKYKFDKMGSWERQKAVYLIGICEDLGYNLNGYGEVNVNENSGYVYVWCEDYNFSLYMPITCELIKNDVYALWTNSYNGNEEEISIKDMDLNDIEKWAEEHEKAVREDN